MLKCDKGNVSINGTMIDLLAEYACITKDLCEQFAEATNDLAGARKMLKNACEKGLLSTEELEELDKKIAPEEIDLLRTKDALDRLLALMEEKMKGENADGRDED